MNEPDSIPAVLTRIAIALEEQNCFNTAWMQLHTTWHEEAEAVTEKRYQEHVKREEEETARLQRWHDEAERVTAQRQWEQVERDEKWRQRQIDVYQAELRRQEQTGGTDE